MKSKQGSMLLGLILGVIGILVLMAVFYTQQGNVLQAKDTAVLGTLAQYLDSENPDDLPSIDRAGELINPITSKYVQELTAHLFDSETYHATFPRGFLSSYSEPQILRTTPDGLSLIFSEYDYLVQGQRLQGIATTIQNADGQQSRITTPRRDLFMRNKKLCVLPVATTVDSIEESTLQALRAVTGLEADVEQRLSLDVIVQAAEVREARIVFFEDTTPLLFSRDGNINDGQDSDAYQLALSGQNEVLFLHYKNHVCFFAMREDTSWIQWFSKNNIEIENNQLIGSETLHPEFVAQAKAANLIAKRGAFNENS